MTESGAAPRGAGKGSAREKREGLAWVLPGAWSQA